MLEDPEQIWERVRAMKEEQGKSLGQIAKDSGVPLTTVKRFFNGATKNPGFLSLCQIIYALGASVDEVLEIDGDCGGCNLQWAWSSGRLACRCAGEVTP